MRIDVKTWARAVRVIPRLNAEEWKQLDFVSQWLISTRFAVVILTIIASLVAGILAFRTGIPNPAIWLLLTIALVFAHATNNLLNDYVDYERGLDRDNYYRMQYGPHPLERGFMTKGELLRRVAVNLAIATAAGIGLVIYRGGLTLPLMLAGLFLLVFYTWPLKYVALGELAILAVWGPLMIAGGYYVLTGSWDWSIVLASLPFGIGATLVILGKHIDKVDMDRERGVHTLPAVVGESPARATALVLVGVQYLAVLALILFHVCTPVLAIAALALPSFFKNMLPMFRSRKPQAPPDDYPPNTWPLWFVGSAFVYTRRFGFLYVVALAADTLLRHYLLTSSAGA